jgi:hypothetical protein
MDQTFFFDLLQVLLLELLKLPVQLLLEPQLPFLVEPLFLALPQLEEVHQNHLEKLQ